MKVKIFPFLKVTLPATALSISNAVIALTLRLLHLKQSIDFNDFQASDSFFKAEQCRECSVSINGSSVNFSGGTVLQGWGLLEDNVYATSNFAFLSDGVSKLDGKIAGSFARRDACTDISVVIMDGADGNRYSLTAYDIYGNVVDRAFADFKPGEKDVFCVSGSNISQFDVCAPDNGKVNFAVSEASFGSLRTIDRPLRPEIRFPKMHEDLINGNIAIRNTKDS
jgi:hypothetical protein